MALDRSTPANDQDLIDEMKTTLTLMVTMIGQVAEYVGLDQEATNLNIVADGEIIGKLSLAEIVRQANAAIARAEARA